MTTLLIIHATFMVISIVITLGTTVALVTKYKLSPKLLAGNVIITTIGTGIGASLLLTNPLDIRCAVLFAYLVGFIAVNRFALVQRRRLLARDISL